MDFAPTETQTMIAAAVERFLADRHGFARRQELLRAGVGHDPAFWRDLAALGLTGIAIDEAQGGSGQGFEELAVVLERFGASLVTAPYVPTVVLAAGLLAELGDAVQQARWLPAIADGTLTAALAHGERQARDTLPWVTTRAARAGDAWRLDGAKAVVPGGDIAELLLVSARTAGAGGDPTGVSLFAVAADAPGLTRRGYPLYDGSGGADLVLNGVALPGDALIGDVGRALPAIARAYDRGAAAACVEGVGAMQALHDLTLGHLKTRRQFGRPLGEFQVLQHRMVDLHMQVELARSMALWAVAAIVEDGPDRARNVSAAKVAIGRAAREVGQSAVQLHGAIALTDDYAAGHYFKRLTMIERLFGGVDHHLARYADALLG